MISTSPSARWSCRHRAPRCSAIFVRASSSLSRQIELRWRSSRPTPDLILLPALVSPPTKPRALRLAKRPDQSARTSTCSLLPPSKRSPNCRTTRLTSLARCVARQHSRGVDDAVLSPNGSARRSSAPPAAKGATALASSPAAIVTTRRRSVEGQANHVRVTYRVRTVFVCRHHQPRPFSAVRPPHRSPRTKRSARSPRYLASKLRGCRELDEVSARGVLSSTSR